MVSLICEFYSSGIDHTRLNAVATRKCALFVDFMEPLSAVSRATVSWHPLVATWLSHALEFRVACLLDLRHLKPHHAWMESSQTCRCNKEHFLD